MYLQRQGIITQFLGYKVSIMGEKHTIIAVKKKGNSVRSSLSVAYLRGLTLCHFRRYFLSVLH